MSHSWRIPDVPEEEHTKHPSIWIAVVALIVAVIAGAIITILNWTQGTSLVSARFFGFALGAPVLVWGVFCAFLYRHSEEWNIRTDWWNYLCRDNFSAWRQWSQLNLAILDTVTLTPEAELAERMLGLDGTPPSNAGKVLALSTSSDAAIATRLEDVLTQLVTPLAGTLHRFAGKRTIHIALQTTQEKQLGILRGVLQQLEISHARIAISRYASKERSAILDDWMTNQSVRYDYVHRRQKTMPDLCLILACQLNEEVTSTHASEAAVALLFASSNMLRDAKLKPIARLFRFIPTATDELPEALKTLIVAEPTPLKRLRNLWISKLPKRDGHAIRSIAKDTEPTLTVLDLDHALGVPGAATPLLMQALAAQAVQYGQGPQLVATPESDGLRLNLVGNEYAPVANAKEPEMVFWECSISAGLSCLTCSMIFLLHELGTSPGWALGALCIGAFLSFVGLPAGAILKRRTVSDEFHRRLQR